jgi:DDE superfamily endonuclease
VEDGSDRRKTNVRGTDGVAEIPTFASSAGYQSRHFTAFCGGPSMPSIWQFQLISLPKYCAMAAADFENISYHRVISNCVGVLDGYLLAIVTPPKQHARNVQSYFSGHYQKYGVNIQACCDAHCRFTFLGIGGPGVRKDRTAIRDCGLYDLVENLPPGYICIGDCAYQPTENLVPIFGGDLALKKENDNFNFFASQL